MKELGRLLRQAPDSPEVRDALDLLETYWLKSARKEQPHEGDCLREVFAQASGEAD